VEVGAGRHQVDDVGLGDPTGAEHVVLELVLAVEDHDGHRLPVVAVAPAPALGELGRGRRAVAQEAEVLGATALHRVRLAGHRRERLAAAQQLGGVGLVLDHQP